MEFCSLPILITMPKDGAIKKFNSKFLFLLVSWNSLWLEICKRATMEMLSITSEGLLQPLLYVLLQVNVNQWLAVSSHRSTSVFVLQY